MRRRGFFGSVLGFLALGRAGGGTAAPASRRTILLQSSPVAGFQYHSGERVWSRLRAGHPLVLVREPGNPYDEDAVRVEWRGRKLGYVPRVENHAVAQLLDGGEKLSARIVRLNESGDRWQRISFEVHLEA